ncbi:MAG: hypothetical protein GXP18_02750 [Gammaproteobacteria bacterium]|nr:hypothetical protein [Gammaproteobacteria bacterium]
MAELTLLVNSTDTALLNGNAAASVAASGKVAGGEFAGVLGKRLMLGERQGGSVTAKESLPQMDEARSAAVTETGEAQPVNGKPLPLVVPQGVPQDTAHKPEAGNPVLDSSLLSAIAQGVPAVNRQTANTSTMGPVPDPARAGGESALQSTLSQLAMARPATESSMPSTLLNATLNSQSTANSQQNISPVLPGAARDAQRVNTSPVIPAMLGKPVSVTAQQALARASLNAGKVHSLRADMMSTTGPVGVNTHYNNSLSGTLNRANNSLGNTMRTDMFAAAMSAATQTGINTELRLPTTSATLTAPVSLIAASALSDDTSNVLTGMPRLPGATVNGVSPTLTVSTPVGQPAWASELGQRVTWLANSELREAQLQLNPRSLGAVDVRIVYGPEQQLSVSFNAANPVARDALDASLPRLREMFEQQGLYLADANISRESPKEREQRDSMNDESLTPVDDRVMDETLIDTAGLHSSSTYWLSEGMLDAYA